MDMENYPKKLSEGTSSKFKKERPISLLPMEYPVLPLSTRRLREARYQQNMMLKLNKAKEELKQDQKTVPKPVLEKDPPGYQSQWRRFFHKIYMRQLELKRLELDEAAKLHNPLANREPVGHFNNWVPRFKPLMKDQATQTPPKKPNCPICLRRESLRVRPNHTLAELAAIRLGRPFILEYARPSPPTRDVAVEAPDRTYYASDQLVFFRVGNFVYRGWTYRTLDGRIEHVPRVPRGIPIDQIRVEKPLRSPAPF